MKKKAVKKVAKRTVKTLSPRFKRAIKKAAEAAKKFTERKDAHLVNFRATSHAQKRFEANAAKYAHGNVSAWLRFAGANFKPVKVPKGLGA